MYQREAGHAAIDAGADFAAQFGGRPLEGDNPGGQAHPAAGVEFRPPLSAARQYHRNHGAATISGGAQPQGIVMLNGQAPAGGAVVSLSSNSPMVSPPASVTVAPGSFSASFPIPTSSVMANTTASANRGESNPHCRPTPTASPVTSAVKYFREEYEAHVYDRKCPAKACTELLAYNIETSKCTGCAVCVKSTGASTSTSRTV